MPTFPRTSVLHDRTASRDISVENEPKEVVIAVDATKDPEDFCFIWALENILEPGDHVTFLGILHRISNPMGYKSQANISSFVGTNEKTLEHETEKTLWHFDQKLRSVSDCFESKGVKVDITIRAGSPLKSILLEEALSIKATHVVLDRNLRRDKKFYQERIKCILVTFSQDNEVEYLRVMYGPYSLYNPRRSVWKVKATDSSNMLVRTTQDSVAFHYPFDSDINLFSHESTFAGLTEGDMSASIQCHSSTTEAEKRVSLHIEDSVPSSKCYLSSNPNNSKASNLFGYRKDGTGEGSSSMTSQSPNHGVCGTMDDSLSDPSSEDYSFIDISIWNSPGGAKSMCSYGQANENSRLPAWTSNCDEPKVAAVFTSTKFSSSQLEDEAPRQVQNMTASSSCSVQREIIPICTQPMRTFPLLKELLKDHNFQNIEDVDANEAVGKPEEVRQTPALHSEELLSSKNKVIEPTNRNFRNIVVQDVREQGKTHDICKSRSQSLMIGNLAKPPPLCSVCKLKSPDLGKATVIFKYKDLRAATNDFSTDNLIGKGGFGLVYKGTLKEGEIVAVKVLKAPSLRGDIQFRAEVEALSCAQHRNLVRLIGYCVENDWRALVYEYVCNGSLDRHLSGQRNGILEWSSRQKIAVGAARGLRYLHEECRAGCIVHRDMRPNNILLTHDFTPTVGDFGLAKLSSNGDVAIETQVVGSLGYVAPEYVDCGQVTTKTDVYSFGIVLLELISGRKAVDLLRPEGELSLIEWARPRLERHKAHELVDPKIAASVDVQEYDRMVKAASLCIKKDPSHRPPMRQILRILEGDIEELQSGSSLDLVPIHKVINLSSQDQDKEDRSCHEPTERLEILHCTTRKATAVPRTLLECFRTC